MFMKFFMFLNPLALFLIMLILEFVYSRIYFSIVTNRNSA